MRKLGWPLVVVLITFFLGLLVLVPTGKEVLFLRSENNKQKKKAEALEAKAETLEEIPVSDLKEKIEFTFKILPAEDNFPLLFSTLGQVATRHSLELREFSLTEQKAGKSFFNSTVVGSRSNLEAFFNDLVSTLPLLAVGEINLQGENESLEAGFTLESFILTTEEKLEPPEQVELLTEKEKEVLKDLEQFSFMEPFSLETLPSTGSGRGDPFF